MTLLGWGLPVMSSHGAPTPHVKISPLRSGAVLCRHPPSATMELHLQRLGFLKLLLDCFRLICLRVDRRQLDRNVDLARRPIRVGRRAIAELQDARWNVFFPIVYGVR